MSFSLLAFRDFCKAKPADRVYDYFSKTTPFREFGVGTIKEDDRDARRADAAVYARPRTYGALTARLDALIEGEKK